ncbi:MAG: DUF444 family protein [Parcubacteria group bacterium]|nr:DUF444 family protein [Parcubacteria group bacterium]
MTDKEHMTELDELGMQLALNKKAKKQFVIFGEQTIASKTTSLESLQDLIKRDKERKEDGFPSKIKFRKVLAAPDKVINVPFVDEEQLIHGQFEPKNIVSLKDQAISSFDMPDIDETTGHGDDEVGDVIDEVPMTGRGDGDDGDEDGDDGDQPGSGAGDEDADYAIEEDAYELGKRLMEQLQLPNLKDKARKVPTDEYTYDLTDRHRGSGQVLDKKETLKRIVKTNLILGKIDKDDLDTKKMLISPGDMVYRVLSRERVWKAQAVVCFLRDYSGSMWGEPTKALMSQHLMIYSWLLVQYERRVIPRFFVHDHSAREVTAKEYFGLGSWGGTFIASGYKKINEVVEGEGLENDYNIYVFQGTDGDDGDFEGEFALPELKKILGYASRMGVTLFKHPYYVSQNINTIFEDYIEESEIIKQSDVFRMHIMPQYYDVTEEMNIEALKALIAQD